MTDFKKSFLWLIYHFYTIFQVYESKIEQLQTKHLSQQELSRELRTENTQLKSDMVSIKSDSDEKGSKIEDLRSHIQRQDIYELEDFYQSLVLL